MKRFLPQLVLMICLTGCKGPGEPVVSADFPGGNIEVLKMGHDTICLKPDLSETAGEWFYWYFKVSNVSDRTITFQFALDNQFTSMGPAYSINNNGNWQWYGSQTVKDNGFTYSFAREDTAAWFCTAIPYTQSNLESFLNTLDSTLQLKQDTLAISQEGRAIEELCITPVDSEPEIRVLLTARHHACEMMASYVLEGIIQAVIHDPSLAYLREHVEFMIIPFMDKDGVENGQQGKNRIPRDHNRDYDGNSLYASTSALREKVPGWSGGRLQVALDLHCPWIRGEYNEWIYMVGSARPSMEAEQLRFSSMLQENTFGILPFRSGDFLPYGMAWNTGSNSTLGTSFSQWAGGMDGIRLASTIEFPYGLVLDEPVSVENAREFGHAVAASIQRYFTGPEVK
ncbi:MAG: M14 family zinc carboxypeptidase [Bacteroidota bacterium]